MTNHQNENSKLSFLDASYLLENNAASHSYGICIFDIDGDDEPEILVANANSSSMIYKYCEKQDRFIDVAPENFKLKNHQTISMCVGDFLGQGKAVIYTLHSDTFGGLKNKYDTFFECTSHDSEKIILKELFLNQPHISNPYAGRSVAALDFTGSGQHGFYVVNYDAPTLFYNYNAALHQAEEVSQKFGLTQFSGGRGIVAQYILNEKAPDIFVTNENGANSFFSKNADGNFYNNKAAPLGLTDDFFNARGVAVADFNHNGLADIVLGNYNGMNSVFMQDKKGEFSNMPPAFFREPMSVRNILIADFDNDGNEEVFVNNFDEPCRMFRYLGTNEWEELDIPELSLAHDFCTGAAYGDLTGNGFLDIFIATGEGQKEKNKLFLGKDNGNYWLRIQPLTQNDFPALSAKVRVFCHAAPAQTKFICSGSGYICQMEPVAHFGFGPKKPDIDYVEITWPGDGVNPPPFCRIEGSALESNTFVKIPHPHTKH